MANWVYAHEKGVRGAISAFALTATLGGGVLAYHLDMESARGHNERAGEQARGYERCRKFVLERASDAPMHELDLTPAQQEDCGLSGMIKKLADERQQVNHDSPSLVIDADPLIRLPSPSSLSHDAQIAQADAGHTSRQDAFMWGVLGGFSGLCVAAALASPFKNIG